MIWKNFIKQNLILDIYLIYNDYYYFQWVKYLIFNINTIILIKILVVSKYSLNTLNGNTNLAIPYKILAKY